MQKIEGDPRAVEFSPPTQAEIEEYDTHVPSGEVRKMLLGLGYGPSKMFVDELYIHKDGKRGVGVLTVTEEHCKDHFGVFRGVDHVEAVGQTILLLQMCAGGLPEEYLPTLKVTDTKGNREVSEGDWEIELDEGLEVNINDSFIEAQHLAYPGSILNVFVEMDEVLGNDFSGSGVVMSRGKVLSAVEGRGQMIKRSLLPKIIERERRLDERCPPLFPPKG